MNFHLALALWLHTQPTPGARTSPSMYRSMSNGLCSQAFLRGFNINGCESAMDLLCVIHPSISLQICHLCYHARPPPYIHVVYATMPIIVSTYTSYLVFAQNILPLS